jgi:DHA3 family macrolide efflux protein-like MFS transporter
MTARWATSSGAPWARIRSCPTRRACGITTGWPTSLVGLVGIGIGALVVGLTPGWLLLMAIIGTGIIGITNPITNGPFFAIMQTVVTPSLQGRVFTVIGSVSSGMAPLGLAIAGPVADRFGVQLWYMVGGLTCLLMAVVILFSPAMMRLEDGRDQPALESVGS